MRTLFLSFVLFVFVCPALAQAQAPQSISDADRAAVAAYNEATAALSDKVREARKEIREKNTALAQTLARAQAEYREEAVIAAHTALTAAHAKLIEAELEGLLLYKTYHPEWQPETDGRRVAVPGGRENSRSQQEEAASKGEPEKK